MNESKISVRYAKAMIEQALDDNVLEQAKQDMDFIDACLSQVPELSVIIESPIIRPSEKKALIRNAMGNNLHPLTASFVNLVFDNKRERYLGSICRHFRFLYNRSVGIKPAVLSTPQQLDQAVREKIVALISKKLNVTIVLEEKIDPTLLGGFLLRIEDQQIDTSIASKLAKLKKEFSE